MSVVQKQYIIYNYHQPKTITGKNFQHFIHEQNLPPLLKVDNFLHEISHTKAYTGLPTSGRNKTDATAHYSCGQKLTCLVTYHSKKLLSWLYYLLVEFKRLHMWFLHPVSCTDGAIHACSFKTGLGIITVYQTTLHTLLVIKKKNISRPKWTAM